MSAFDDLYHDLSRMRRAGAISADYYMKCCVSIAYEHTRVGRNHDALQVLSQCTPEYVRDVFPVQAEEDASFFAAASLLARALVDAGLVVPDADVDATMTAVVPPGKPS